MRHPTFANEIFECAKNIKINQLQILEDKISSIKEQCIDDKEFLLSLGYAVHYSDSEETSHIITKLFKVMGVETSSENANAISENSKNCNVKNLRPHIEKMIADGSNNNDMDTLVRDLMAGVYYSVGTKEQSLVLRLTETTIDNLINSQNKNHKKPQMETSMRHPAFATEIVECASNTNFSELSILKEKISSIKEKCSDNKEFLLSLGYAVHYADNEETSHIISRLFKAMGVEGPSENSSAISEGSKNFNINKLRPHIEKMLIDASKSNDLDTLVKDLMAGVYYSAGSKEQSLVLRVTETTIDQLSKGDNVIYKTSKMENENSLGM